MREGPLLRAAGWLGLLLALLALPSSLAARDLSVQIEEVQRLVLEKNYVTALEDLKFIAQQIQEFRLAEVQPLFPEPPPGWETTLAVRTSREGEFWSRRLEVRKTYLPESGTGKMVLIYDFYSPLIPSISISLNPVYITGDPRTEAIEYADAPGRLSFTPDTGEGELVLILDNRILVTILGRGISTRSTLRDFAGLIDYSSLKVFSPP
jgi:hypothetical protein